MAVSSLADYEASWQASASALSWHCLFVLPFWLRTVQNHLGIRGEPMILTVSEGSEIIGHLPLSVQDRTACFMGIPDVCDYQDMVARPGDEDAVMAAAVAHLKSRGIVHMDLQTLRPDAVALKALRVLAKAGALNMDTLAHGVTYETGLPAQWEDYLMGLSGKQRHEVRRKIRRLEARGPFRFGRAAGPEEIERGMQTFLRLFRLNRADKAEFMNTAMAGYFRELMAGLAREKMLRLCFLEVGAAPAAAVLCFDYNGVRYLYNSGFDAQYQDLSVGVLSKVFSIQNAIESGCRHYDFLKGAEAYKKRIGGREVALYRCSVDL